MEKFDLFIYDKDCFNLIIKRFLCLKYQFKRKLLRNLKKKI